jgi:tetratricopeptide (TPR) repeat protein
MMNMNCLIQTKDYMLNISATKTDDRISVKGDEKMNFYHIFSTVVFFLFNMTKKGMKNKVVYFVLIALVIASCKTTVNLTQYRESAETAEAAGDYLIATEAWRAYFAQFPADNEPEDSVYAHAARTAYRANKINQALEWFEKAMQKGYDESWMYQTLAEIHKFQGNISKELTALEEYSERVDKADPEAYSRLFSIYYTTDQSEKAMEAWEKMPDTEKRTEQNLERYFSLNKQLDNEAKIDSVSLALLKVAPEHVGALEWQAQKKYEQAEARYQREMKQYKARPTTGNYQTLLRGLKAASDIFRQSLQYFEKLWEVNPEERDQYAVYMNNIHIRFNDKDRADFYRKYIN